MVPVLAAAGYGLYLAAEAGEFRAVENLRPGACRTVPGLPGPEDIAVHPARDVAYVSSFDRRAAMAGSARPGSIFRIGLDGGDPIDLIPDAGPDFRPHGISLHVDPNGRETLFVVNHPGEALFGDAPAGYRGPAHTIEIFDVAGNRLVHRARLTDPLLVRPNDVVAVDDTRFYFTNDHGSEPGPMRKVEDYLRLPWANVVHYDGEGFREVADGLARFTSPRSHGHFYGAETLATALADSPLTSIDLSVGSVVALAGVVAASLATTSSTATVAGGPYPVVLALAVGLLVAGLVAPRPRVPTRIAPGEPLPAGLTESDRLDPPVFSPATKAESGHDENVSFEVVADALGTGAGVAVNTDGMAEAAAGAANVQQRAHGRELAARLNCPHRTVSDSRELMDRLAAGSRSAPVTPVPSIASTTRSGSSRSRSRESRTVSVSYSARWRAAQFSRAMSVEMLSGRPSRRTVTS